jgi:hypothetical protein
LAAPFDAVLGMQVAAGVAPPQAIGPVRMRFWGNVLVGHRHQLQGNPAMGWRCPEDDGDATG